MDIELEPSVAADPNPIDRMAFARISLRILGGVAMVLKCRRVTDRRVFGEWHRLWLWEREYIATRILPTGGGSRSDVHALFGYSDTDRSNP